VNDFVNKDFLTTFIHGKFCFEQTIILSNCKQSVSFNLLFQ